MKRIQVETPPCAVPKEAAGRFSAGSVSVVSPLKKRGSSPVLALPSCPVRQGRITTAPLQEGPWISICLARRAGPSLVHLPTWAWPAFSALAMMVATVVFGCRRLSVTVVTTFPLPRPRELWKCLANCARSGTAPFGSRSCRTRYPCR